MTVYRFEVPGKPVPWQRVRRGRNGATYVPKETQEYEARVGWCAKAAGVRPIVGPVRLTMSFYVPDNRARDGDNLQKSVMDGLKGIGYLDDKQVKSWSGEIDVDREKPRAFISLEPLVTQPTRHKRNGAESP